MEEEVFLFEKSSPVQVAWYRSKQKKKFIILMVYKVIVRQLMFSHGMPRAD